MSEADRCPQCGAELLDAQPRLCPACLLKLGLSGVVPIEPPQPEKQAAAPVQRRKLIWAAAAVLLLALATIYLRARSSAPPPRVVKLAVLPPDNSTLGALAVSPDGRSLAFTATDATGRDQLWLRPLDSLEARPLVGTDGAAFPFWSPDSRFIGFFSGGKLKKVAASGGSALTLCDAPNGRGGTWGANGVIIFAPAESSPLSRISSAGGDAQTATALDGSRKETAQRWPFFLPDGRHFLYTSHSEQRERSGIYVGSLEDGARKQLLSDFSNATYAAGHLLFGRGRTLMAQPFDDRKLEIFGEPALVADQLGYNVRETYSPYSASHNGVLAFDSSGGAGEDQLTWFDRSGRSLGPLGEPALHARPVLSPDGRRLIVVREEPQTGRPDLWLHDLARGIVSRFTFDQSSRSGIWAPDGSRIVFASNRADGSGMYVKPPNGMREELVLKSSQRALPTDWSPDGRFLLYQQLDPKTSWDLWVLPLSGDKKPVPFLNTIFAEEDGVFSPDGRWIAYDSDESGRSEVYVQAFPTDGSPSQSKWQISPTGGSTPKWRRDGRELFYLAPDKTMMAVAVQTGAAFQSDSPRPLLRTANADLRAGFAVTPDGQRFLIPVPASEPVSPAATVIINWTAGIGK